MRNLTVKFAIKGDDVTAIFMGVGKAELEQALGKMADGLPWVLTVRKVNLDRVMTDNAGKNCFSFPDE